MTRTLQQIDSELREAQDQLAVILSPPRAVSNGNGITLADGWTEDADAPLRFYLDPFGFAHCYGILYTPNDSSATTICTLPTEFRHQAGTSELICNMSLHVNSVISTVDLFVCVRTNGQVEVDTNVAALNNVATRIVFSWYTKYPGVF